MAYKAVVVRRSDDELMHWKYIKKKKVNGKWRYYYPENAASNDVASKKDKYIIKEDILKENVIKENVIKENILKEDILEETFVDAAGNPVDKNGNPINVKSKTDNKVISGIKNTLNVKVAELDYKLSKSIAKAEKWIYNNVLNTDFGNALANVTANVESKVSQLFNSLKRKKRK